MDYNHQFRQDELPGDIFNSSNGDIKTFNGQQVRVGINGNGTRQLTPLSSSELAQRNQQAASDAALKNAQQIRDFNIQSNQPAIQSLQKSSTDLDSKYKDLLTSIKGQQAVSENAQTLATNNELGRRGITADSGLAQQQQASALRPIDAQYQSLAANTGLSQQKDMSDIANQIASLQSGNPEQAFSSGMGLYNATQQASQFGQQLQAGQQSAQNQAALQMALQQLKNEALKSVGRYGVYDPTSGQVVAGGGAVGAGVNNNGW